MGAVLRQIAEAMRTLLEQVLTELAKILAIQFWQATLLVIGVFAGFLSLGIIR